jgi:hypothetical protein
MNKKKKLISLNKQDYYNNNEKNLFKSTYKIIYFKKQFLKLINII